MWLKTNECLYHVTIVNILNVILKRIKASSRDVIMEETHMEEQYKTKMMNQFSRYKISQVIYRSQDDLL